MPPYRLSGWLDRRTWQFLAAAERRTAAPQRKFIILRSGPAEATVRQRRAASPAPAARQTGANAVLKSSVSTTDSDKHALLQRICGLSGPPSHQKTHRR